MDGGRRNILCLNLKVTYVDLIKINRTNSNRCLQFSLIQWLSVELPLCVRRNSRFIYLINIYRAPPKPQVLCWILPIKFWARQTVLPSEVLWLSEGDSYLSNTHTVNAWLYIIRRAKRKKCTMHWSLKIDGSNLAWVVRRATLRSWHLSYLKDDGGENIMFKGSVAGRNIDSRNRKKASVAGVQRTSRRVMMLEGWWVRSDHAEPHGPL